MDTGAKKKWVGNYVRGGGRGRDRGRLEWRCQRSLSLRGKEGDTMIQWTLNCIGDAFGHQVMVTTTQQGSFPSAGGRGVDRRSATRSPPGPAYSLIVYT